MEGSATVGQIQDSLEAKAANVNSASTEHETEVLTANQTEVSTGVNNEKMSDISG